MMTIQSQIVKIFFYLFLFFYFASVIISFVQNLDQLVMKNIKTMTLLKFAFSNSYDLITVGPYANRIAKAVSYHDTSLSILTVQQNNNIFEPTLVNQGSPWIPLKQKNNKFADIEMGVGLKCINPDTSHIYLNNGSKYNYKQLIYSGCISEWKDQRQNNQSDDTSIRSKKCSFIHNDMEYENICEVFARRGGSVVFTVPQGFHFACENYFMMILKHRIQSNRKIAPFQTDPIKITVLCQGSDLVPFNKALNSLIQDYLSCSGIRVVNNVNWSIDKQKRIIKVHKNNEQIKFDSLFSYLPTAVPKVLKKAGIDPFKTNLQFLNHSIYENIYILGNNIPSIHSLKSTVERSKVIAQNILFSNAKMKQRAVYEGQSSIDVWISDQQCHYLETDYDGSRIRRDLGPTKLTRQLFANFRHNYWKKSVEKCVNSSFNIFPFINQTQLISTDRNIVPMLIF